jgi:hypothetical protein
MPPSCRPRFQWHGDSCPCGFRNRKPPGNDLSLSGHGGMNVIRVVSAQERTGKSARATRSSSLRREMTA